MAEPGAAAVTVLRQPPFLPRAYARALLLRRPGLRDGEALPRLAIRLEDVAVDARRLAAYRKLCGFAAGERLPATYPFLLATPLQLELLTSPSFPLPVLGLIHRQNSIREHEDIATDARLDVECAVGAQRPSERGLELELETRVEVAGRLVWEAVSTILAPRRRTPAKERSRAVVSAAAEASPATTSTWHLPGDIGRRYARLSGDYNPIHLFAATARPFGFRGAIAHGNFTQARALAELAALVPDRPRTTRVQFKRPLLLPGSATLTAVRAEDGVRFSLRAGADLYLGGEVVAGLQTASVPVPSEL